MKSESYTALLLCVSPLQRQQGLRAMAAPAIILVDGSSTKDDWGFAACFDHMHTYQAALQRGTRDCAEAESMALLAGIGLGTEQCSSIIVIVDRTSVFSNLKYELLQSGGKKARSVSYRRIIWQMIRDVMDIANHSGEEVLVTIMSRKVAYEKKLIDKVALNHKWLPHTVIEGLRRNKEYRFDIGPIIDVEEHYMRAEASKWIDVIAAVGDEITFRGRPNPHKIRKLPPRAAQDEEQQH